LLAKTTVGSISVKGDKAVPNVKDLFADVDFAHPCLVEALHYLLDEARQIVLQPPPPQDLMMPGQDMIVTVRALIELRARRLRSNATFKAAA
jgi:hypothetical protein